MKRYFVAVVIFLLLSQFFANWVWADSLWTEESRAIFTSKPRVFKEGDLLTLVIMEQASASYKSGTDGDEAGSFSVGGKGLLGNILPYLQAGTDNSYSGEGSTSRKGMLTAQLTVCVTQVELGTGNLLIEGKQKIEVNQDAQELTVRGRIRPEDINRDNTIYSSYVADAEISLSGRGVYNQHTKPGILTRFFSWLL